MSAPASKMGLKPVVLVTGASAGLGEAICHRFARGGYDVVAVARRAEKLEQLVHALEGTAAVATIAGDVRSLDLGEKAVGLAMEKFGRLDCLVNNAGSGRWAPVHNTDDEMMEEVLDINLKAPFRFSRAALRVMNAGSSIVFVGSTWGILGGLGGGMYCVAKAALGGLTRSIAADYGSRGIRANLVAPGVVRTAMTDNHWDSPPFQRFNREMTPANRDCVPDDVAETAWFLAQPNYINGQTVAVDGGWTTTKFLSREALLAERTGNLAQTV